MWLDLRRVVPFFYVKVCVNLNKVEQVVKNNNLSVPLVPLVHCTMNWRIGLSYAHVMNSLRSLKKSIGRRSANESVYQIAVVRTPHE